MHTFTKSRNDDGTYLYCVGYWCPAVYNEQACWEPLRDCSTAAEAAMWVNFLNGGAWVANDKQRACIVEDWSYGT